MNSSDAPLAAGSGEIHSRRGQYPEADPELNAIARHVFAPKAERIADIEYAIEYELANRFSGGDVLDVYEFDNGSVAFMAADVSGRGAQAAMQAALIKFAARAYASAGMTPETVMRTLDRLYLENNAFERIESFATVFFAHIDAERRTMGYASAGHDLAILVRPGETPRLLPVTAPIIGVFEDAHALFAQRYIELVKGSVLVLATDGITEARDASGEFFGIDRLIERIADGRDGTMRDLAAGVLDDAVSFAGSAIHDDMAVVGIRFL